MNEKKKVKIYIYTENIMKSRICVPGMCRSGRIGWPIERSEKGNSGTLFRDWSKRPWGEI